MKEDKNKTGEIRCLTATEIAEVVKSRRELLDIKQLTLAQKSGVTERTIQRLESGQRVDDRTLKDVAVALGFTPSAFVGPRAIRGTEEAAKDIVAFLENYQFIDAPLVEDWRAFETLMCVQGVLIDDSELDAQTAEQVAELRDHLHESLDFADLLDSRGRMEHAKQMYELLQQIELRGVVSRFAVADTVDGMKIGALILVPQDHEKAHVSKALFPNYFAAVMGSGPSPDDVRMADRLLDCMKMASKRSGL